MAGRKKYDDDDGRTIADMSGIDRPPLIIPRLPKGKNKPKAGEIPEGREKPEWESDEMSARDRGAFISGVLTATLGIASVFAVAIAIAILIISHIGH